MRKEGDFEKNSAVLWDEVLKIFEYAVGAGLIFLVQQECM